MSNAKWRPSTSAANVSQSAPETSGAAQLQSMLDRLKQRPSLLATQTALPSGTRDVSESRSRSPRCDSSTQRSTARCRSSTGVARLQQGAAPGGSDRRSSATPRSAERRRSRYSDVIDLEERLPLTDRSESRRDRPADTTGQKNDDLERRADGTAQRGDANEHGTKMGKRSCDTTNRAADASDQRSEGTPRRTETCGRRGAAAGPTCRRGLNLAPADTSQSALSSSADSSQATSTSAALTPDAGTQVSLTGSSARQTPRTADGPPVGSAARQFQVRPRREPAPDGAKQATDSGNKKPAAIPPIVRKTLMDFDRIQKLKYAAETAMREKKVFMIHGGYPSIRLALKRRGWVEKKYLINKNESEDDIDVSRWPIDTDTDNPVASIGLSDVLSLKGSKNSMILTRLLKDHHPNLIWSAKREVIDYMNLERDQLVNHFSRAPFNTKVGLCSLVQNLHWYSESMTADTFIPRAYRIGMAEEKQEFVEDFRLTACASLLVWFKERYELHGAAGVEDADGEVPYSVIPTALQQCQAYMAGRKHEDIEPSAFNRALWPHQWDNFITNVYKVVHRSKKLEKHRDENSTIVKVFYNRVTQLLTELAKYRPQTLLDGWLNIWIVKPGSSSRGRGIILLRHLEDILALVDSATQREGKYVVQKYVERPMLIYNTKFDIRQWFLVTDWNPLTVWMYKQSYLRFCSQQFTLGDLKEVVHLCNNAIQARYRNGERHAALPTENMWDSSTFQQFLKTREAGHAWDQLIYPAMKSAIISLCLASQTELEPRKGCFELFGADFLLTEDFHPWLIEVNSSPAMGASTSVTAWLCAMCLEDVIRVIVDRRKDSHADVGEFECILQQPPVSSPRYLGIDLSVHGHRLKPPAGAAAPPPPPSPAVSEPPPTPRAPAVNTSVTGRSSEAFSRLTSLPAAAAAAAAAAATQVRQRSLSQAARSPTATTATATTATPRRNRSVSQAIPAAQRPPPPAQKPRQKAAAKKAAAARRRSRTQLIQNSVRRLSDPRRPRSGQQQRQEAEDTAVTAVPAPAACPPRAALELTGRRWEPSSPRAQQLVTCDRLQEPRRGGGAQLSVTSLPATGGPGRAAASATSLQPHHGGGGAQQAQQLADTPTELTRPGSQPRSAQATSDSRFVSNSLDKLERMRRASEDTVRRIHSLSLAAGPAAAAAVAAVVAEVAAGTETIGSSVQEVHMKQTGKVKWVAMPHPPPSFSATPTAAPGSPASPAPRTGSPAARTVSPTPAPRTVSPVPRSLSPVPRAASPVPRAVTPSAVPSVPRPASPRAASPALSPRPSSRSGRPVSSSASWSTAAGQSAGPGPASADSGTALLPALNLPAPGLPSADLPPAAFNTRITELKTLIDRAIEETREFLGRSRGSARASPLLSAEPAAMPAGTPSSPRPCLSPTIVDIAVRRPPGPSAWERASAEVLDSPRPGSARLSPRRGPTRGSPAAAAAAAAAAGAGAEPARLTELVGLQARRFLPQLNAPQPAPRRSR